MIQLSLENWQTFYAQLDLKSAFNTSFFIAWLLMELRNKANTDLLKLGIAAFLLSAANASDRTTGFVGSAERFRRMIFWPKIP